MGAVTRVDLAFTSGVDCSNATHSVTLNGLVVGSFPNTYDCYCLPTHISQSLPDVATSTYIKGGIERGPVVDQLLFGPEHGRERDLRPRHRDLCRSGPQPAVETGCRTGLQSKLKYKNSATDTKDKLGWKWLKGAATSGAEFGDPTDTADYQLCVFGQSSGTPLVLFAADVPANATLVGPSGSNNFKYNDSGGAQGGLSKILLKGGGSQQGEDHSRRARAPTSATRPCRSPWARRASWCSSRTRRAGLCWQSMFPIASVSQDATGLKASAP